VLTDPADCGPVTLALPQDVQAEAFDFPSSLFEPVVHRPTRPRADWTTLTHAVNLLRASRRPLMILGGGVRYSDATHDAITFAETHGVPITETTAGRTLVPHDHPLHAGPLGITGSASANAMAADADLVLAVGTRLQDFTTASWSVFDPDVRLVSINTARFDAVKHGGLAVVGDARETLRELTVDGWAVDESWTGRAFVERSGWDDYIDKLREPSAGLPTYAQVVGVVNDAAEPTPRWSGSSTTRPSRVTT